MVLIGSEGEAQDNLWICDTGVTCHMIGKDMGLINVKTVDHQITVGDGRSLKSIKMGNLKLEFIQKYGENLHITLKDVKLVDGLKFNLFSVNCALKSGANL